MERHALVDYLGRQFFRHCEPEVGAGLNRAWGALYALLQDEMEETAATHAAAPCGLSTPEISARILPPKDNIGARGSEARIATMGKAGTTVADRIEIEAIHNQR
jgi:hypothetical protein